MSLKHGLLGLLNYKSMTGYELDKEFKESLAYLWTAKASQIYRELDMMEQSGWLTSERVIQEDKPNKRVYSITDQGKTEFLKWLISYDPFTGPAKHKNTFLMRLFFGGEIEKEHTEQLLHKAKEKTLETFRELETIKGWFETGEIFEISEDPKKIIYWKLTLMYGEIMNKAQVEWIDEAITLLEEDENQ